MPQPVSQNSSALLPPLAVKAVSGSLPPVSLPFGSAVTGKHFKADLPRPKDFSKISVDADIHR